MEERRFIPAVQVRSNALVYFEIPDPPYSHARHDLKAHKPYSGVVTAHAMRRIKRTVDVFLQRSPERRIYNTAGGYFQNFRLNFITLTIAHPKPIPAKEGHAALKVFLQHFKAPPAKKAISERLSSYLWKCELQERGQLHYHITANRFLHFAEIQRVWNGIQFRRGWLQDFQARHGHTNPNSTDVHAVYKVRDIQAYLSKYLAKTGSKDVSEYGFPAPVFTPRIDGKVWDASNDLKVPRFADELDSETESNIRGGLSQGSIRQLSFKMCEVFCTSAPGQFLSNSIHQNYLKWKS